MTRVQRCVFLHQDLSHASHRASGSSSVHVYSLAYYVYARTNHPDEIRKLLAELTTVRARQYVPADGFIAAYAQLGNLDAAFAELERAVLARDWSALMIGMYPEYAPLRADPRYEKIRSETHLAGVPSAPVPP